MTTPMRIDVREAHAKVETGEAVLVCAYDDEEKCKRLRLDGAYTLGELRDHRDELADDAEVIFYCG